MLATVVPSPGDSELVPDVVGIDVGHVPLDRVDVLDVLPLIGSSSE